MITRHLVFQAREVDQPDFSYQTIVDPKDWGSRLPWNDNCDYENQWRIQWLKGNLRYLLVVLSSTSGFL